MNRQTVINAVAFGIFGYNVANMAVQSRDGVGAVLCFAAFFICLVNSLIPDNE